MVLDGTLWALLERPMFDPTGDAREGFARLLEFDTANRAWTGRTEKLRLPPGTGAFGDINAIGPNRALVIARDGRQGDPSLICGESQTSGCYARPARIKQVMIVDFDADAETGVLTPLRTVDLLDISDPSGIIRTAAPETGRFSFPFVTIESVLRDGPNHILVANDNNLPFSTGRHPDKPDDTEIIRLFVPDLFAD